LSVIGTILIFAILVNTGLGLLVFLKRSTFKQINITFAVLAWASAGWILSVLLAYYFENPSFRLLWGRLSFATSGIIPTAFLLFAILFPRYQRMIKSFKLFLLCLPAIFFMVLSFSNQIIASLGDGPQMFIYGSFYPIFSIYLSGYLFLGFGILIKKYKNAIGVERLQVKYCLLGMFLTSSIGLLSNLFLPMMGVSKFNWLGPSLTMIMVGFTTYSILKHRLMDISIVFKKGTTYILLLLLLFIPSFILILLGQKIFFERIDYLFTMIMFFVVFLAAILFHRIKPKTEKAVDTLFFKDRYNYRKTLGEFSKAMVNILDLQSLVKRIIETITQTMRVDKASLFLLNDEKGGYDLFESKNIKILSPPLFLRKEAPLPSHLQKMREIVVKEELAKGANIPELKEVIQQMSSLEAEVSIPLISKNKLIGMINLSHKFNKDVYYQEDIDLLTTLANQTAMAIENASLFEDLKKSKSYIRRADRLASLGTLTAGLAHEIRNPLVAIKTLTQLLPERVDDEEFRNHFLSIAAGEVERISHLVNELLDFAKPSTPKLELEDVNSILDGMILLISTESKKKSIHIEKQYASNLPSIKVDREQIKQVFLNILLNAIEATPERGKITIRTRSFLKPGGEPYLQVEFKDTGCGIPQEYLEEIFNPFYTTKATGSGLGLSISNQIVRDHKGYIDVESQMDKGTSFFINLPLDQDHQRRRRADLETRSRTFFEPR
jgi:signal transduction histidine kinase